MAAPKAEPLVVTLNPQQPEALRRLVESAAPAEEPAKQTDLISDRNTQAQDESERTGERAQPSADRIADFEDIASPPPAQPVTSAPPTAVARAVPPTPTEEGEPPEETRREEEPAEREEPTASAPEQRREPRPDALPILEPVEPTPREETADQQVEAQQQRAEEALPEPFELAQVSPSAVTAEPGPPSISPPNDGASVARDNSGVVDRGAFSFEAHQHELGPYLLEVRRKVERRWRANMRLRYSGSGPADAVLECSISPEGRLVSVKIIEPGRSATFAALCKQALEQAAPFSAFPFDVPDVYTDENLVIRWKFSFL